MTHGNTVPKIYVESASFIETKIGRYLKASIKISVRKFCCELWLDAIALTDVKKKRR